MTFEKYSDSRFRSTFCAVVTFVTLAAVVVVAFVTLIVVFSDPVCFKFDCKSNQTQVLGKLVRYPKKFGVRKFSEERDLARARDALQRDQVVLGSLHFESGIFSAKFSRSWKNESANFREFVIVCPKFLLQQSGAQCYFPK